MSRAGRESSGPVSAAQRARTTAAPRTRAERRAGRAVARELPVTLAQLQSRVEGTIRFIQRAGAIERAFVRTGLLFEPGEELSIDFVLPSGRAVRARGRVETIHRERDGGPGLTLALRDISEPDCEAIGAWLADR